MQNRSAFVENYVQKKFDDVISNEIALLNIGCPEKILKRQIEERLEHLNTLWAYAKTLPKIYFHF